MTFIIILGLCLLNGLISWWNCKVVGSMWQESKCLGGFPRLLAWSGAVQSAVGFSSIMLVLLVFGAMAGHWLPPRAANAAMNLWYLLIVFPALGSGLIITIHSWREFWRERTWGNAGVTAWNSLAMAHNAYQAASGIGSAFQGVSEFFSGGDDDDNSLLAAVVLIVLLSLGAGIGLTVWLINRYAQEPLPAPEFG